MNKLPYIIGIPFRAVVLVLGGAMLWIRNTPQALKTTAMAHPAPLPNPLHQGAGSKPSNSFNQLFVTSAPQPTVMSTPTPASAAAMNADVNSVGDDGGASDFSSLQSQVSGL
jgi:hypothetical protein